MTNISECINAMMTGSRNLSITSLVKSTYFWLGELFARKGSEALAQLQVGVKFLQTLMKDIEFNSKHINSMNLYQFDRSRTSYTVEVLAAVPGFRQQNYQVLLDEGNCDCGYFQELHLPCRYILAACSQARIDWKGFVHPLYRMDSIFNVYKVQFRPIGHEDDWPSYDRPNPRMMRVKKGQPVSSRIQNNMDDVEHTKEKRCGLCRQTSHTQKICTAIDGAGTIQISTTLSLSCLYTEDAVREASAPDTHRCHRQVVKYRTELDRAEDQGQADE
ncbi:uncharacterized protein [Arachis hypogaea]|uniref:uncharacterized protein n=1 Tax=Arachis hypogaea TaxID=3818 RepID=UPI003B217151